MHTQKYSFNAVSCGSEYFKNSLILCLINRCNKIDINIWCSTFHIEFQSGSSRLVKAIKKIFLTFTNQFGKNFSMTVTRVLAPTGAVIYDYRNTFNPIFFCNVEAKSTTFYVASIMWTSQPLRLAWKTLTVPFLQWCK